MSDSSSDQSWAGSQMTTLYGRLTKAQVRVFLGLLALFTTLTFLITNAGVGDGAAHDTRVIQATLGTITGPLTGAISRGFQSCCLEFSLGLMVFCAPVLLIGILVQLLRLPEAHWAAILRMSTWVIGWLVWFGGGILSFGHTP